MENKLKKYWSVITITWANGFAYPASFWMWRLRQVIQIVIAISLWESIFSSTTSAFGYDKTHMFTYIFVANIINYVVLSSRTIGIVDVIHSGDLSLYLVKPLNFFAYWFSSDLADKCQNILFSVCELAALLFIYRPDMYLPQHILTVALTILAVLGGMVMYFCINMLFGFIGFWSPDAWAPRFLFFMIMFFIAGTYFPLDIFPQAVVKMLWFTPFPYLIFFQTKIWLEQFTLSELMYGFIGLTAWITSLSLLMAYVWKKGVRGYGAEGR